MNQKLLNRPQNARKSRKPNFTLRTIEKEVPQGAVISPILFNIMVSDFIENERNKSLLFSDYVTIFAQVHKGTGHK
jgi:retron-type reverse transcriptase